MSKQQTSEDMSLVRLYLLLPLVLSAFERDKELASYTFRTPEPYMRMIDAAQRKVEADLKEVRKKFRELGIKVYEEHLTFTGLDAKYLVRGYHHNFSMLSSLIAAESQVLMEKYLGLDITQYIKTDLPEGMRQEI
ncbi:hypothetical protein [Paenibacillus bouchesdurhonensis]|uniref:hypothetical protein n=1 Tax=Paenibacillus bouchesdurhonensis TaxID=1870990 RepID=UPI000DA5FADB|nr:hypothetical protein [Paenibacillus bouchesdurhonensis]